MRHLLLLCAGILLGFTLASVKVTKVQQLPVPASEIQPPVVDWSDAYLIYEAKTPDLERIPIKFNGPIA